MTTGSNDVVGKKPLDLRSPRRIHIVGLGGSGMSAIAEILIGTGHQVSGSDLTNSAPLQRLAEAGVQTYVGHAADQVGDAEAVAVSTAIPASNPEVVAALDRGIPVLRRAEILAAITGAWKTISVAGTHGKTTTSAMLTVALQGAGLDPAFIVGGDLRDLGRGAAVGEGEILVVEADESDGTFVELHSSGVIITNVEPDHLEHYGGFAGLQSAFVRFIDEAAGPKVVCLDDPGSAELIRGRNDVITYGTASASTWRISNVLPTPGGIRFDVVGPGVEGSQAQRLELSLRQPGMHNARNATAALAMAASLGADVERAAQALSDFGGVGRRFEVRGEWDGIQLVDDYAHLPTEVEAALAAGRSLAPERLVAVFQPHRYSRTEQLWSTFSNSFVDADVLIIAGIYSAGEEPRPGVTGQLIADDVQSAFPDADVRYIQSLDEVVVELVSELRCGDLCMTLGAGDLTTIPGRVLQGLAGESASSDPWSTETLAASTLLGDLARHDVDLGPWCTYRVGGPAALFVTVQSVADLEVTSAAIRSSGTKILVVGKGSNLLVADRGFDGVVLHLGEFFAKTSVDGSVLTAGGGAMLPVIARYSVREGLRGLEWAVGVPGTVGGAVRMNAGGHGSEIARILLDVSVFDLATGQTKRMKPGDLALGYRTSSITDNQLVIGARFQLEAADAVESDALLSEIVRWRRENQPGGQNAGSVFANPAGESAGRLIDEAGLKGFRLGSAQVSEKHANFIQADPNGSADDIFALIRLIQDRIVQSTGLLLRPENRLIGFDSDPHDSHSHDPEPNDSDPNDSDWMSQP